MKKIFFVLILLTLTFSGFFFYRLSMHPKSNLSTMPALKQSIQMPSIKIPNALNLKQSFDESLWKNKKMILHVWASWCDACRHDHLSMMHIHQRYPELEIYGIAYQDQPSQILEFLKKHGNPYRSIGLDHDGKVGLQLDIYGIPETYLIDEKGHIAYRHVGSLDPDTFDQNIKPLLDI